MIRGRRVVTGSGRLLAVLLAVAPHVAAASPIAIKNLTRLHDPVVLRCAQLGALPDRHTASYRMYAVHDGRSEPIPFQFDPIDASGALVGTDDATLTFDDDDELVLMAKDTGDRLEAATLPSGATAAVEIEVTDRTRAAQGWAYLAYFPQTPPAPSPVHYATFDAAADEARALWYQADYSSDRSNYLGGIRITPAAGGTGDPLIERMVMRIVPTFSLLLTDWSPTFTERSFTVSPLAVRNGPVRAVRRVKQALELGRFFPEVPSGTVQTNYYFSSFSTPSTFRIPGIVLASLRDFRFEAIHDFGSHANGRRYWDASNPAGVPLAAGRDRAGIESDHDWWVTSGPGGTLLNAFAIPDRWRAWGITRGTVLGGDDGAPADVPTCGAGYCLRHMTNMREPGAYQMQTALIVLPKPYAPGDEGDALAMLRQPLAVAVRPVALR